MIPEKNFQGLSPDDLRMENELKKIKLMFEHGTSFIYPDDHNDIPPEVEFEFLKNIEAFERARDINKKVTVFEFVGSPDFRNHDSIPDAEMKSALKEMMKVLHESQVDITTICEVEDRDLYRFITEELFLHEMDDIHVEGMMCCFIYEEFHPNHEYDIKDHSADFITSFLNKDSDFYTAFISNEPETISFLNNFRNAYECFSLTHFSISNVSFNTEKAFVNFMIRFTGIIEGGNEKQSFNGEGEMELVYEYDFWSVQKIKFPSHR